MALQPLKWDQRLWHSHPAACSSGFSSSSSHNRNNSSRQLGTMTCLQQTVTAATTVAP
jgi:hypothetical protein